MKILHALIAFNTIAIPVLVFLHFQGECKYISAYLLDVFPKTCDYISNLWLNIAYVNGIMMFVALVASGKGTAGKTPSRPQSSGSSGSSKSSHSDSSRSKH